MPVILKLAQASCTRTKQTRGTHRRLPLEPADEERKPAESNEQSRRQHERPGRHRVCYNFCC